MQGLGAASGQSNASIAAVSGGQGQQDCLMDVLSFSSHAKGFNGKKFVVAVHVVPPFLMYDESKSGNDAFSGITADLLTALADELVCEFVLVLADPERPSTSMAPLDALQFKKKFPEAGNVPADIAGGAIRIASNRSKYVHYTLPFYDSGFQLVVRVPDDPINPTVSTRVT